ncbi:hypothetical protein D9M68_879960 [compost metagenome]
MQGFDEHLLTNAGFAMYQDRNVFLQQSLGLAYGFIHARVAEVDRGQGKALADGRWLRGGAEIPRLERRRLLRAFDLGMEAKTPAGAQAEWVCFGLVEQLLQGHVEQAFDIHPRQSDAKQAVGAAVGRYHLALVIEDQQAGPGAVEVGQAGVEG